MLRDRSGKWRTARPIASGVLIGTLIGISAPVSAEPEARRRQPLRSKVAKRGTERYEKSQRGIRLLGLSALFIPTGKLRIGRSQRNRFARVSKDDRGRLVITKTGFTSYPNPYSDNAWTERASDQHRETRHVRKGLWRLVPRSWFLAHHLRGYERSASAEKRSAPTDK